MINFELLAVLNLGVTVLALWRLRPATFFIAASQVTILRALINIRDFGQPESEWMNPASVCSISNLEIASHLFAVSTVLLVVLALINPKHRPLNPATLPPVPRWFLIFIFLFLALIILSSQTILSYGRMDAQRIVLPLGVSFEQTGLANMLCSVLLYELYRRVALVQLKPIFGFLIIVLVFSLTDYLKGQTAQGTGFIICGAMLLLGAAPGRRDLRRLLGIAAIALLSVLVAATVRFVRNDLWSEGWSTIAQYSTNLLNQEPSKATTGQGLEKDTNGTQYAAHVLEGISLYDAGISRQWRSFTDPLIITFEPSFLVEPLGLTRPLTAPWELGHYFWQGGGFYILGEFYWNGGYLALIFGFLLVAGWAFLCDTRYRTSPLWLILGCTFAPPLLEGVGYGFTTTFRGAFDGFLVVGGYLFLRALKRRAPAPRYNLALQPRTRQPSGAAVNAAGLDPRRASAQILAVPPARLP